MLRIENQFQSIAFDQVSGRLVSLYAKSINREFLEEGRRPFQLPVVVWHQPIAPFIFSHRTYLWDTKPPEPDDCFAKTFNLKPAGFAVAGNILTVDYADGDAGISACLSVRLDGVKSYWQLTISNNSGRTHEIMPVFPNISGINLSRQTGKMLIMNQSGHVGDIWAHRGGVYGVTFHNSAQFGCLFENQACLGFYVADDQFGPKDIRYQYPAISVRWFKSFLLAPGQSQIMPETVLMVYGGSWKQTAVAYGDWFRASIKPLQTPDWVRRLDSYTGVWAEKKSSEGPAQAGLSIGMDSFEELPRAYLAKPYEALEYAFYCEQSMFGRFGSQWSPAETRRHTDGLNVVRPDLGGAVAMRRGIEDVHRMGRKIILYIEGLIVPQEGKLFELMPAARDWIVHNIGGDNIGPYTREGWFHMCPGSKAWQDHLADMVVRLIQETGIDGIRLDSLGGYHWHCYNPAHRHESPFDYNRWVLELLDKVGRAARSVKPDFLLSTEHPVDNYYAHFNHSLHQIIRHTDLTWAVNETSPMRVAFPDYKICYWGGGGVSGSLQLMPDGFGHSDSTLCGRLDDCWTNVRQSVAPTLVDGQLAMPDPDVSRQDAFCRWVRGQGEDVIIGARPVTDVNDPAISQKREMFLQTDTVETTVSLPVGYCPCQAFLYDIEKQTLQLLAFACDGATVTFTTRSNWFMAILTSETKAAPAIIHASDSIAAGEKLLISVDSPAETPLGRGYIEINGLPGFEALPVEIPGTLAVDLPGGMLPGQYILRLSGDKVRPVQKLVRIELAV